VIVNFETTLKITHLATSTWLEEGGPQLSKVKGAPGRVRAGRY